MSLQHLSISLHCWPARRPTRRGPASALPGAGAEEPVARRFPLAEVTVEGDDVRDIERFDSMLAEALVEAADRLRRVAADRLGTLREMGYATRVEIAATADGGPYELALPAEFVDACHRLGVSVYLASDASVVDPVEDLAS